MESLLGESDPRTVRRCNPHGASPFLLIGDHAGNAIPASLGDLGLNQTERTRHIAWDIGVEALGQALSDRLDAVFISQTWSRLVIDCNRDPATAGAMPEISDGTTIPGNLALTEDQKRARIEAVHEPYQDAIAAEIARRTAASQPTVLISLHSFTPIWQGAARIWDGGVLHDGRNEGFARALLAALRDLPGLVIGDNEPYRMDTVDHTVPRHAFSANLPYAEIEIRQDQLADAAGVDVWAERMQAGLDETLSRVRLS